MCFLSVGVHERESVPTSPCKHQNMAALKRKVRVEFGKIPEKMFQKSIMNMKNMNMNMKKRAALMAGVEGRHFEGCGGIKQ